MDVYQRRRLVALSILAGVFVIVVLLIRSCGGDDEETPVTPVAGATGVGGATSLSQEDYISQADDTCLEANTSLAAVDQSDPATAATEEGQILAGELEALQTLAPPTEGTDDLDKYLSRLQDQVSVYDDYITALERGDAAATELEAELDRNASKAQRAAEDFGFEVCGDPSQTGESSGGEEATTEGETDTGAETTEPAPVEPTETVPVEPPVEAPPTDDGGVAPVAPTEPTDEGTDSGSGGVSP